MIARGVRRLLRVRGFSSLTELPLVDGRRADIAAVNDEGEVLIVEIKSSPPTFGPTASGGTIAARCDRLYFAISERHAGHAGACRSGPHRRRSVRRGDPARGGVAADGAGEAGGR